MFAGWLYAKRNNKNGEDSDVGLDVEEFMRGLVSSRGFSDRPDRNNALPWPAIGVIGMFALSIPNCLTQWLPFLEYA